MCFSIFSLYFKAAKASFRMLRVQRVMNDKSPRNSLYSHVFRVLDKEIAVCCRIDYLPVVSVKVFPAENHVCSVWTNIYDQASNCLRSYPPSPQRGKSGKPRIVPTRVESTFDSLQNF